MLMISSTKVTVNYKLSRKAVAYDFFSFASLQTTHVFIKRNECLMKCQLPMGKNVVYVSASRFCSD